MRFLWRKLLTTARATLGGASAAAPIAVEPRGNLDTRRDGYNLRCVFLGSKAALSLNGLELLVRSP